MNRSEQLNELAVALVKFHAVATNPKKNATNPHLKSKYADLSEVINVSRTPLAECGLSIVQFESFESGFAKVETMLLHVSGQWVSNELSLPCTKLDAQGIGSVLAYARRYSWSAILGLAQEDDDGSATGQRPQTTPDAQKPPYTLEMAQAKTGAWESSPKPIEAKRLLATIRQQHTVESDVETYITDIVNTRNQELSAGE